VNPANENVTSYNKTRFLHSIVNANKFVAQNEVLVASELWNFLSGEENTMEEILAIINTIATTGFLSKFHLLQDNSNRNSQERINQLREWNLLSELQLVENDFVLQRKITTSALKRNYNKVIFKDGNYDWERYNVLKELL
jgi:hypothetical protein